MEQLKLKLAAAKPNLNTREVKSLYDQILALAKESKNPDIPENTNEKMDDATIQKLEIRYKKALEDNLYDEAGGIKEQIHNLRRMAR